MLIFWLITQVLVNQCKLEGDAAFVYGGGASTLIIADRQNERMRIDSGGRLLIGNTSSSEGRLVLQQSSDTSSGGFALFDSTKTQALLGFGEMGLVVGLLFILTTEELQILLLRIIMLE